MDSQQFKEFGKAAIEFIAEFNDTVRERDVLPAVEPGYLLSLLPESPPEEGQDWQSVFKDFKDTIIPGLAAWQSPQFHGFYPCGSSYPSIVGSLLTDGLGTICLTWASGPVNTELEIVTLNWLGKMMGLPEEFLNSSSGTGGGVIHSSASEAVFVCLLAAKEKTLRRLKQDPNFDEDQAKLKLVAYTSDQCNSAIEKAGVLGSMKMRLLKSDSRGRLHGETLKRAIQEDKEKGLIPCYVVATLGTTATCAFDLLEELGPICQEEIVWLHVDAAYAGAAFICPEYKYLANGVSYADSFNFNAHKWLLTNISVSPTWVKNEIDIIKAFDVQRVYLADINSGIKIPDFRHWQVPLGRRFRALKLWLVLKIYGAKGLREHIRNQVSLAQYFAQLVRTDKRFVVDPEPSMGLVCIRLVEGDDLTKTLLDNLIAKRKVFMVSAFSDSKVIIRVTIGSRFTNKSDIEVTWNLIKAEADILFGESPKDI
ncbi:3,4-dihydroxyphenylacetaldehyde synthase-like [Pieris rapae]|uniref:3,4-dihydroxyphenylacetaldehyde synthase-like n=1 Tax=Pieris rapae TaxID=64459 RepID=UPI001E27B456|nr:3,4-dihydroxyphenylacetaldehyde synthase-like [Pieris rapae]